MNRVTLILILLLTYVSSYAQQDVLYSHYMFNTLVVNPAYAGSKKVWNLDMLYRHQWVGLDGNPISQSISIDGPVRNEKVGLALHLVNDATGARDRTKIMATYAYRMQVSMNGHLSLGLSGGFLQSSLNGPDLQGNQEQSFGMLSEIMPDANTGVYFNNEKMYFGASANDLFSMMIDSFNQEKELATGSRGIHYFLTAGYLITLNERLKFKPSVLYKFDYNNDNEKSTAPSQLDINTFLLLDDRFWVGVGYRTNDAVVGLIEYYINKSLRIGYSYDWTTTELRNYSAGSHEIEVGYFFYPKKKKDTRMLTPRYF